TLVYEVFTGLLRASIVQSDRMGVPAAAFSPDSRFLALGSQNGELRIIDMRTSASVGPFAGHRGVMTGLAFSRDGKRLASTNYDATAVVWDVAKLLAKMPQPGLASAPTAQQLDDWWANLAASDGRAVGEAVWSLADRPQEALGLFRDKLKPVVGPEPTTVSKWVAELDYPKYQVREKAAHQLASMGESARPALTEGLSRAVSAEARFRLTRLLQVINSQVAPGKLQPLRALEVLEKIGGAESRKQLEVLANQSTDDEIRKEIERVLQRWK